MHPKLDLGLGATTSTVKEASENSVCDVTVRQDDAARFRPLLHAAWLLGARLTPANWLTAAVCQRAKPVVGTNVPFPMRCRGCRFRIVGLSREDLDNDSTPALEVDGGRADPLLRCFDVITRQPVGMPRSPPSSHPARGESSKANLAGPRAASELGHLLYARSERRKLHHSSVLSLKEARDENWNPRSARWSRCRERG